MPTSRGGFARGHPAETVAYFINRLVFCMFAEDVDLLPNKMFKRMLEQAQAQPEDFEGMARDLFGAMKAGALATRPDTPIHAIFPDDPPPAT